MAFRVETTTQAKRDLDDILKRLLSQEAGETGLRWFQGLHQAVATLADSPRRCALAPENAIFPFEVRHLLYGRKPMSTELSSPLKATRCPFYISAMDAASRSPSINRRQKNALRPDCSQLILAKLTSA
jgi:plasmid stabilization system protein ParE